VTAGGSSIPEVQRLLAVLAAGKRVAEAGTGFGAGAAALASTAASVVTCELDPERHTACALQLDGRANVELLAGDWRELLPPLGPFDLLFLDGGDFKQRPERNGRAAVELVRPGGLLVIDDFTPGLPGPDPARLFLLEHPQLVATELLTTPETAAIVAARVA
jgi:predicted O-methyltransferase YrrM